MLVVLGRPVWLSLGWTRDWAASTSRKSSGAPTDTPTRTYIASTDCDCCEEGGWRDVAEGSGGGWTSVAHGQQREAESFGGEDCVVIGFRPQVRLGLAKSSSLQLDARALSLCLSHSLTLDQGGRESRETLFRGCPDWAGSTMGVDTQDSNRSKRTKKGKTRTRRHDGCKRKMGEAGYIPRTTLLQAGGGRI